MGTGRCSRCGNELKELDGGLCPACLLQLGLGAPTAGDAPTRLGADGVGVPRSQDERVSDRIGPYQLIAVLGEGGMGVVYLAEQQAPIRRTVALKLIKLGMDTREVVARFEAERQTLALMDHPNIASVLDAGATPEGRPYFVMEYAPGVPITDYCDTHQLSTTTRLQLFITVCGAVQHAHQKGIIHRDLKPSNVLIVEQDGRPVPKVIDFGIAKATNQRLAERQHFTQYGLLVGTPEYMSPEQTDPGTADLDTRTDIYSLGVVLYELLVGGLPFAPDRLRAAGYSELLRIIREEEPPRPSARLSTLGVTATDVARRRHTKPPTLAQQLRGDLDWITLKALEKDRARRYSAASELAADLARYLQHEPVVARPPALNYRVRKFVRRNRLAVTAAGIVSLAVVGGLIVSTVMYARADAQRLEAQHQAYLANITLADVSLTSLSLLNTQKYLAQTEPALRSWEWSHLLFRSDPSVIRLGAWGNFGHFPFPSTFVFSSDGSRFAWNTEETLHVWDARNFRHLATYAGLDRIRTIGPDLRLAVSASSNAKDFTLTVREVASRRTVSSFTGHTAEAYDVRFSPDGRMVASSGSDGVRVWQVESGRLVTALDGEHFAFSPDGRLAVATKGPVVVWSPTAPAPVEMTGVTGRPLAYSPDGRRIVTATSDTLAIHTIASTTPPVLLRGHQLLKNVYAAFSPDGSLVASVAIDRSLRMWNAVSGELLSTTIGTFTQLGLNSVAFDPTSRFVLSGESALRSGAVSVWDAATAGGRLTVRGAAPIAFVPRSSLLVTGSEEGALQIWDTDRRVTQRTLSARGARALSIAVDGQGQRLASGDDDHAIRIWDIETGQLLATLTGHTGQIASVAFSASGTRLVSTADDRSVRIWSVPGGQVLASHQMSDAPASASFSADGRFVYVGLGSLDGVAEGTRTLQRWEWAADRIAAAIKARGEGNVQFVSVSRDGAKIAVSGRDYEMGASIWDSSLQRKLASLSTDWPMGNAIFSGDGRRIVASDWIDGTVRIFSADRFEQVLTLSSPVRSQLALAVSDDGSRIAGASAEHVYLWQTRTPDDARAREIVSRLFGELKVSEAVIERLRRMRELSPQARQLAITYAEARGDTPYYLNRDAWTTLLTPGASRDGYRIALESAEVATRLSPTDQTYRTTLGLAQYRVGEYQRCVDTLDLSVSAVTRSAIVAMARYRLGQIEEGKRLLRTVQDNLSRRTTPVPSELAQVFGEAAELIEGRKR